METITSMITKQTQIPALHKDRLVHSENKFGNFAFQKNCWCLNTLLFVDKLNQETDKSGLLNWRHWSKGKEVQANDTSKYITLTHLLTKLGKTYRWVALGISPFYLCCFCYTSINKNRVQVARKGGFEWGNQDTSHTWCYYMMWKAT